MSIKSFGKKILFGMLERHGKRAFFSHQKNTFELDDATVKKANRMGFTADEYAIFNLEKNNPNEYISEYERDRFRHYVSDYRIILDNKIVFYEIVRNFANTNRIFAYKANGSYQALEVGYELEKLLERLKSNGALVYKRTDSGGGNGFALLLWENGSLQINRKPAAAEDLEKLLDADNYLIEEYCCQSDFENSIWPFSVNTIRIITLSHHGKTEAVAAFHRMGAASEKCVDNADAGGLYTAIDLSTGALTAARSYSKANLAHSDGSFKRFSKHPVTGAQIEGLIVPNWNSMKESLISLHERLSFTGIEFISWDVACVENGYKIIEANTSTTMKFLQTFGGVRNAAIGQWMKEKGYIK